MSWCELDLTFDLAVVILIYNITFLSVFLEAFFTTKLHLQFGLS